MNASSKVIDLGFEALRAKHSADSAIALAEKAAALGNQQMASDLRKAAVLHEQRSVALSRKAPAIRLRAERAMRRQKKEALV